MWLIIPLTSLTLFKYLMRAFMKWPPPWEWLVSKNQMGDPPNSLCCCNLFQQKMSNSWDAAILNELPFTGAFRALPTCCPVFNHTNEILRKPCEPRVMVGGDGIQEGAAGRKGNLYLLIWIRWPGSVTVFTTPYGPRRGHKQNNRDANNLGCAHYNGHCCWGFFCKVYMLFFVLQIPFIKLPVELMVILAMFPKPPSIQSSSLHLLR